MFIPDSSGLRAPYPRALRKGLDVSSPKCELVCALSGQKGAGACRDQAKPNYLHCPEQQGRGREGLGTPFLGYSREGGNPLGPVPNSAGPQCIGQDSTCHTQAQVLAEGYASDNGSGQFSVRCRKVSARPSQIGVLIPPFTCSLHRPWESAQWGQ